ncbi:hypothetical protein EI94DRAFT_1726922 [Lactarius quietus]|nr:hypothetical protein EI94DRAFT_1726922 [Lactarius quietus]
MTGFEVDKVIRECLIPFPYIWFLEEFLEDDLDDSEIFLECFMILLWICCMIYLIIMFDIKLFKSLPTIQNLILNGSSHHHLIIAIILILKHAMFLMWHSNDSKSALFQAEQNYQGENIDSKILEYLKEVSSENSVKEFLRFIMATDIVPTQSSIHTSE